MCITSKAARKFSLGASTTPDNVGPGLYDTSFKRERYHAPIPFGSTTRRELFPVNTDCPDLCPGMYDPIPQLKVTNAPLSIGKAERTYFVDKQHFPGPANYSQLSDWTRGVHKVPHSSLRASDSRVPYDTLKLCVENPGPGSYDVKPPEPEHAISFSRSRAPQREPVYDNGIPGPGAYSTENNHKKLQPSPFFRGSTEDRDIFGTKNALDGYMLEHTAWKAEEPTKRPFGGLVKRELQFVKDNGVPGPGKYVHTSEYKPKIVGKRSDFGVNRDPYKGYPISYPGPGFYEMQKFKSNGCFMAKAGRGQLFATNNNPAPGQYNLNEQQIIETKEKRRIPNPAFKSSINRDCLVSKEPGPGPAMYGRMASGRRSCMVFPKGKRFVDNNNSNFPGPDSYTLPSERKPAPSIGLSSIPRRRINNTPGPADYGEVTCEMYKPSYNVKLNER